ncbi:hypothetical protein AB6A40_008460 [Gnathostoma spinigerum]|uniref:adenosine deaminase n=1 Tax=Gnathostoma spinigerum TaxID=75299 RepID=A0ABD6ER17_9BILA
MDETNYAGRLAVFLTCFSSTFTLLLTASHQRPQTVLTNVSNRKMASMNETIPVLPVTEEDRKLFSFPKVILHLHLDGSVRLSTLFELAKEKESDLECVTDFEEFKKRLTIHRPVDLSQMLAPFDLFLPLLVGDADAIERVAYEMCEDQARDGVIYFEARYSPHFLSNTVQNTASSRPGGPFRGKGDLTPKDVVKAVKRGFDRGEKDFSIKARQILCFIRGFDSWMHDVLVLAKEMSSYGVVGIDGAGTSIAAGEDYDESVVKLYKEALEAGIHRTLHAGESGGANEVVKAVETMHVERIGHGYHILDDEKAYKEIAIKQKIHLEACPYSSVMTGSVKPNWTQHPVKRWADDRINFSISMDDPTCFENTIITEMKLAYQEIGLTITQLWECMLNAAQSSFASDADKKEIIKKIEEAKPQC